MLSRCTWETPTWCAGHRLKWSANYPANYPHSRVSSCSLLHSQHARCVSIRPIQATGSNNRNNRKRWQLAAVSICAALGTALALFGDAQFLGLESTTQRHKFTPYELVGRQPVSSTLSIFHLRLPTPPPPNSKNVAVYRQAWQVGIWNVLFKQPQIQVVRAYTPLPPSQQDDDSCCQDLRFLIRHDPRGEVSSWLFRLPVGSNIEVKGPNVEFEIPESTRNVTFLAGGTGIAPALQAAHALLARSSANSQSNYHDCRSAELPSIHILWASRQREDCIGGVSDTPNGPNITSSGALSLFRNLFSTPTSTPNQAPPSSSSIKGLMVQELDALKAKYPQQVKVDYFVDEEDTFINEDIVARSVTTTTTSPLIIVSGPDGFIGHFAGPKVWQSGREQQGPVAGVVARALSQMQRQASSAPSEAVAPAKVWKV